MLIKYNNVFKIFNQCGYFGDDDERDEYNECVLNNFFIYLL